MKTNFRNTLILLALLAALAAYVLLVETKQPPPSNENAPTERPTPLPQILTLQPGEVRALRLARPATEERTELVFRDDGLWYITAPIQEEANQSSVISLVASLSNLRPTRVLTATVGQPSDYELDPPVMLVEIEMVDGAIHTLNLGVPNASRSGYYGQVAGDGRIHLLPFHIGVDVERFLNEPPVKPTPVPTLEGTIPPRIPLPTATLGG